MHRKDADGGDGRYTQEDEKNEFQRSEEFFLFRKIILPRANIEECARKIEKRSHKHQF